MTSEPRSLLHTFPHTDCPRCTELIVASSEACPSCGAPIPSQSPALFDIPRIPAGLKVTYRAAAADERSGYRESAGTPPAALSVTTRESDVDRKSRRGLAVVTLVLGGVVGGGIALVATSGGLDGGTALIVAASLCVFALAYVAFALALGPAPALHLDAQGIRRTSTRLPLPRFMGGGPVSAPLSDVRELPFGRTPVMKGADIYAVELVHEGGRDGLWHSVRAREVRFVSALLHAALTQREVGHLGEHAPAWPFDDLDA